MSPAKDVYEIRFLLQKYILIKHNCKYEEPGISQFEKVGYILTKPIKNYSSMSRMALVHTREVQAEDVVKMKKTKQLKFLCSPSRIYVTAYKLAACGYDVESSGIHYCPKYIVGLKKKDRDICEEFIRSLNDIPNVVQIYDNIQRDLV